MSRIQPTTIPLGKDGLGNASPSTGVVTSLPRMTTKPLPLRSG
jgi:hypothetical protein